MNACQAKVFRLVLAATGCPARAARAARQQFRRGLRRVRRCQNQPAQGPGAAEPAKALCLAVEALESEAVRRALAGVQIPVFHQGRECGSTVKHSDQLLMFLLKTLHPQRYAAARPQEPEAGLGPVVLDIDLSRADEEMQAE